MTSSYPRSSGAAEEVDGIENPAARRRDVDVGDPLGQGFAKACLREGGVEVEERRAPARERGRAAAN